MARVSCAVDHVFLRNDEGHEIEGVEVICSRCGQTSESFGIGAASVRRCLALLREECPEDKRHYYVAEDGEDQDED